MASRVVNGIDIGELKKTMRDLEEVPELAQFNFRARNTWIDGTHNRAVVKEFYEAGEEDSSREEEMVFDEDEPPVLLGKNDGANPVEFVLIGLSGCLTTALVANAAAKGIKLRSVESELDGDLDIRGFLGMKEDVRNGYEAIRVKFKIDADATEEEIKDLVDAARHRSPVFDVVTNKVPVFVGAEKI